MADKERTVTERVRESMNSPTGKRVISGIESAAGVGVERETVQRARSAWNKRNKGKERRSSGR